MRNTGAGRPAAITGSRSRCGWCVSPDGPKWVREVLAGASLRSVSEKTPFSLSSASRHMNLHVRGPLQLAHEGTAVEGTTVSTFAERLLEIADDARRLRAHALANSNATTMLRAMAAERDALNALMNHMGIDEAGVIDSLVDAKLLRGAVVDIIRKRPELADTVADVYDRAGQSATGDEIRSMGTQRAKALAADSALRLVPSPDGPR